MKVAPWVAVGAVALGLGSACGGDSHTSWGGSSGSSGIAAGAPNGMSGKGGNGGSAGAGLSGSSAGGRATAGEGGRAQSGAASIGGAEGGAEAVNIGGDGVTGGAGGEVGTAGAGGAPPSDGGAAGSESAAGAGGEGGGYTHEPPLECELDPPKPTLLPACQPSATTNPCSACLQASCCSEWKACYGEAPNSVCGYDPDPEVLGQMDCLYSCYLFNDPDDTDDPDQILEYCADQCKGGCPYLDPLTIELVACGKDECVEECFPFY